MGKSKFNSCLILKKIVTYNYGRSKINSMKTERFNGFDEKYISVLCLTKP